MGERWTVEQAVALAPDAPAAVAGRSQASANRWSEAGATAVAVWGLCRGSGAAPYATVVDLTGPAFRCSCPSRKVPCKHVLGLLLLWASGGVPDREAPAAFAADWLVTRSRAPRRPADVDPELSAERAAARRARREEAIGAGLDELQRWLRDQLRSGLAAAERSGYGEFDRIAARLVDAQAPGAAAAVRRLPAVAHSGPGWPERLLTELARLELLAEAFRTIGRLDADDPDLAATVRAHVGIAVSKHAVLQRPPVSDLWSVLGRQDRVEQGLQSRRVWLRGTTTARTAVVLSFAPSGQELDGSLVPGTAIEADVHFYPGAAPLRALVGEQRQGPLPFVSPRGTTAAAALGTRAAALAADPWTRGWPDVLDDVVPARTSDGGWALGHDGDHPAALPLAPGVDPWRLVAESGGHPVRVLVETSRAGTTPIAVLRDDDAVAV